MRRPPNDAGDSGLFDFPTGQPESPQRPSREADEGWHSEEAAGQQDLFEPQSQPLEDDPTDDRATVEVTADPVDDLWLEESSADHAREPMQAGSGHDTHDAHDSHGHHTHDAGYEAVREDVFEHAEAEHLGSGGIDPEEAVPALATRALAGMADILLHLVALAVGLLSMLALNLEPATELWPGFLVLVLAFSFMYTTLPLAFWGRTPGMAWQGLRSVDVDGMSMTYSQTVLRWVAGVVTVALAGIPLLLALFGGSLADRVSATETIVED